VSWQRLNQTQPWETLSCTCLTLTQSAG